MNDGPKFYVLTSMIYLAIVLFAAILMTAVVEMILQ